jgi:two-component system OmpR family response regulator
MHLLYATDHHADAYLIKALREAGHVVDATEYGSDALAMAPDGDYQVILLDWSGPPVDCARRFAAAAPEASVVVIAATGDSAARTRVLKAGADAYFIRPVAFMELEARLEALARLVQRRRPTAEQARIELVVAERAVRFGDRTSPLSGREYHLMEFLLAHPDEVISLERLQQQVPPQAQDRPPGRRRAPQIRQRPRLCPAIRLGRGQAPGQDEPDFILAAIPV